MTTFYGSCHCDQINWSVKLEKEQQAHVLCHCNTCKKLGGGVFSCNQIIPKSNLKIIKGANAINTYTYYGDSGKAVNCYYCSNCTSHVYHHQDVMGPDTIIARTILLGDAGLKFPAGAEIFGKDRLPWEKEVAQTFAVMPPEPGSSKL